MYCTRPQRSVPDPSTAQLRLGWRKAFRTDQGWEAAQKTAYHEDFHRLICQLLDGGWQAGGLCSLAAAPWKVLQEALDRVLRERIAGV